MLQQHRRLFIALKSIFITLCFYLPTGSADSSKLYTNQAPRESNSAFTPPPSFSETLYTPAAPVPADIAAGRCERRQAAREAVGTVLGGIIGGLIGAKVAEGDRRELLTLGGMLLGAFIGNRIAAGMDEGDYSCTNRALEFAADKIAVAWENPAAKRRYKVQPLQSYKNDEGRYCRTFITEVQLEEQKDIVKGYACRDDEGVWRGLS